VNASGTTSGSSSGAEKPALGRHVHPEGYSGLVLWVAEPSRKLSIITGYLLRTALDVVNRGRPFHTLPVDIGIVNGGVVPVIQRDVADLRPVFPFRPRIAEPTWRNVLVTLAQRSDVRRGKCHASEAVVGAVALQDLVRALETSGESADRDVHDLISRLTYEATVRSGSDAAPTSAEVHSAADLCQQTIVGLADGWL